MGNAAASPPQNLAVMTALGHCHAAAKRQRDFAHPDPTGMCELHLECNGESAATWRRSAAGRASITAAMKILVAATLIAAGITAPAVAHADCGDPEQNPCVGPIPTADQVVAIMAELTDPNIPAANKGGIVTPAFTPEEAWMVDDHLNHMAAHYLPLNFVVTDIEPAPHNLAGATVAATGPIPFYMHPYPRPIVLDEQGGHWLLTNESAINMLDVFCHAAMRQPRGRSGDAQCGPRISTVG